MSDEDKEALTKALRRQHRIAQFLWGWCWAQVVDLMMKLTGVNPTETSAWVLVLLLVMSGCLAQHFGRKLDKTEFSVSFK